MIFNSGTGVLDAVVLSVVSIEKDGTYGYKITQDVRELIEVSESSLYPVLRRLQTGNYLETYDQEYNGRNRRYYKITDDGKKLLESYKEEWLEYRKIMNKILLGGEND